MKLRTISLCKRWSIAALLCAAAQVVAAQPFSFVALGDLPYGQAAQGYAPYKSLISSINQERPSFSIHIGDFKSGSTLCSDEESQVQLGHFGLFDSALMRHHFQSSTDCFQAFDLMFFNRSSNKACFYQFIDEIL